MLDSFKTRRELIIGDQSFQYFSLKVLEKAGLKNIERLPYSLKILLENQLRHEDGHTVTQEDIHAFANWLEKSHLEREIAYRPARVLMQDFTGVPAVVDLAAMRDAMVKLNGDPNKINPHCPVDLIIDHSVQVDTFGHPNAYIENTRIEMNRNRERYTFLKWGQCSLDNFQVVPPGTGICHQVNLEYLARTVWFKSVNGTHIAYPDTLVGTDSHTTMINGLGVLGWGVGGIEAEAALLGQPISMLIPDVVGFCLEGHLKEGVTATDLVLTITQMLRQKGVVGKFVEFYGPGLKALPVADRATIANMSPEYGATCGLFPVDEETIQYLELTNRDLVTLELVRGYTQAQGMWHDENSPEPIFSDRLVLDLATVEPSLAGPRRPQDRVTITTLRQTTDIAIDRYQKTQEINKDFPMRNNHILHHGDVVIAAITSCTNTSNPSVMLTAGLLAKKAVKIGLQPKPWVKCSLAPGSKVVTDYLQKTGLIDYLQQLDFYLVGYGCTTCIGNSGPLPEPVSDVINDNDLVVCAILSGNRNFEGRIHPQVKANWLASPPLVVAFALAGTTRLNLNVDALGEDKKGNPVYLKDIWPTHDEIKGAMTQVTKEMFNKEYTEIFQGTAEWQAIKVAGEKTYDWNPDSTYVKPPPFFENMRIEPDPIRNITGARILALLGDSVTTDHISPAGAIKPDSPAGKYLIEHDIGVKDFNSYGSRRGNHEVMMRGTFANIRIHNEIVPDIEGGFTQYFPNKDVMPIYDAAMKYKEKNVPLIVVAGCEYGTGSSRDWAAKGPLLLGVKAVVAESFERIHRSNLIGMGVLPLRFKEGVTRKTLNLDGSEMIDIIGLEKGMKPKMLVTLRITRQNGNTEETPLLVRIDTQNELEYYLHGGILQYVLRNMLKGKF